MQPRYYAILMLTLLLQCHIHAQTPGMIITSASVPGNTLLNPDRHGYASTILSNFVRNNKEKYVI